MRRPCNSAHNATKLDAPDYFQAFRHCKLQQEILNHDILKKLWFEEDLDPITLQELERRLDDIKAILRGLLESGEKLQDVEAIENILNLEWQQMERGILRTQDILRKLHEKQKMLRKLHEKQDMLRKLRNSMTTVVLSGLPLHSFTFLRSIMAGVSRRSGLYMNVNGETVDVFGDTGSTTNIVDEAFARTKGWYINDDPAAMVLGDKSTLHSPGTVRIETAFVGESGQCMTTIARVVRNFPFDVLLGRPFLEATSTLTHFFHRFKTCQFPRLTREMAFNFVSTMDVHALDLLDIQLGGQTENALLDTGANRNIADYDWAMKRGLEIKTEDEYRGWIILPSGDRKATLGQVETMITLADGREVPITLEVLEDCAVPLVLGDDAIFQYQLFEGESNDKLKGQFFGMADELLHMDYLPWYHRIVNKAKERYQGPIAGPANATIDESKELDRQLQWERKHAHGKSATFEDWMQEYYRRERHQKALHPGIDISKMLLIQYV